MNKMLEVGRSGMSAHQTRLDRISNNLANLETIGYKKTDATFAELVRQAMQSDSVSISSELPEDQASVGGGIRARRAAVDLRQGTLWESNEFFHFAIDGPGFFGVRGSEGQLLLTRNGSFSLTEDGKVTDSEGRMLEISLSSDPAAWNPAHMSLRDDGTLIGRHPEKESKEVLGRVKLYDVPDRNGLLSWGGGCYSIPEGSGVYDSEMHPGDFGHLRAYSLERSNVSLLEEMTQMMATQRAYQLNAKSVSAADEMMQAINEIL